MLAKDRCAIVRKWYDLILAHADDLALILTTEQGKPLAEAKAEIAIGAAYVEWFAEEGKRVYGDVIPTIGSDRRLVVDQAAGRRVRGDHAVELPAFDDHAQGGARARRGLHGRDASRPKRRRTRRWPWPSSRIAPASRPACSTSSSARPRKIGGEMCANPTVRKLSFTGSTEVGRMLMAQVAPTIKKLSLELGGNAPFIVFDDADLDAAAEGAIISKYRNAGQTCVCANRLFVQDKVYDAFAAKLAERVSKLIVGNGRKPA